MKDIDYIKEHGFVEVSRRTEKLISAEHSVDPYYVDFQCGGSKVRKPSNKEFNENMKHYDSTGKCKFHIFEDSPTCCGYYSRDCLVCGRHIGLI